MKTIWTIEMDNFLLENYSKFTNQQLAFKLGLTLTVTRNRLYELGLQRIEMEYWSGEQIDFLRANYKTMGDVEIAGHFQKVFNKNKLWTKQQIRKKRLYLNLHRTSSEIRFIRHKNSSPGGNQYTINKNSASLSLPDKYIASMIAWRNKELQKEILKYPEIIELKRSQLKLIKEIKNAT
ncbi:MAG: hypothetical protein KF816_11615 [Melioribacteraceae bacterium]|nr:hypothetical protein [Melioribacteraceae bacterium]